MPSRQAYLQVNTHRRVMSILHENLALTECKLADRLSVNVNGLNYCLKALMERGWVKMQNVRCSKSKYDHVDSLTLEGIAQQPAPTGRFITRRMAEYEALTLEIELLRAKEAQEGAALRRSSKDLPRQFCPSFP